MSDDQTQHGSTTVSKLDPFSVTPKKFSFDDIRKKSNDNADKVKSEWMLPEINDLPQRFRAKARHIAQSNPDNYRELLWQAVKLSEHNGDEYYGGHHVSLQGICSLAIRRSLIDEDPESASYKGFVKKMIDSYDHPNPEKQVAMAMAKAMSKDAPDEFAPTETYGFDPEILKQHEPTKLEELTKDSPLDAEQLSEITPRQFVQTIFTDEVLNIASKTAKKTKQGFVAVAKKSDDYSTIFNPNDDKKLYDAQTSALVPDSLHGYNFIAKSVFDTTSDNGGRRLNENVKKVPFMIFEMDYPDKYFQQCFTTFVMVVAKFAPLIAVIDSGGKSVHYWFYVGTTPKDVLEIFMKRAIQHGADRSVLKTDNRLVRMPNVEANEANRRYQSLLFFAPDKVINDPFVSWDVDGFEEYMQFLSNVDCYYADGEWYYRSPAREFIKIDRAFLTNHCNVLGCWNWKIDGQVETPANEYLIKRMSTHYVHAVYNRVAGYRAGVHILRDDTKILVRRSPKMLDMNDTSDKWMQNIEPTLRECFHGDEYHYFMGWLSSSVIDFYNNGAEKGVSTFSQSLYLNIVGKANSGKSFLLYHLMTPLFGMGAFDASGLFKEDNDFNSTESANELLFLDDSDKIKDTDNYRKWHGEMVKNMCVSTGGFIHPKGRDKTKIKLFRRLVRLLNFNKIHTLPNVNEESIADKILILACQNTHIDSEGVIQKNERSRKWGESMEKEFKKELPSFFNYLVKEYKIPKHIQPDQDEARFPVKAYKNDEVMELFKTGSRTGFIRDCINTASLPPNAERNGIPAIEASVDKLHRMFSEYLPNAYRADYNRQFYKSQQLLATLRELREEMNTMVYESSVDNLVPSLIDNENYWRITVPHQKKSTTNNLFS